MKTLRSLFRTTALIAVVIVLHLMPHSVWAFTVPGWLFSVEVPVTAQTNEERARAAEIGLLELMTRLTGLISVPRNPTVAAALEQPQLYYNQYLFYKKRGPDGDAGTHVRITYQSDAVLNLLKDAGLPVWGSRRPQVTAWIVIDLDGERIILDDETQHPIVEAFRARAQARGLPINLPKMDATDRMNVSVGDVWGRYVNTLQESSQRYEADVVLVGRIRVRQGGQTPMVADWEYWVDGQASSARRESADYDEIVASGIDQLADELASRYAVLPRGLQRHQVAIEGLSDVAAYAELLNYFGSLEFIDSVHIESVARDRFVFGFETRASMDQLLSLLTVEQRLVSLDSISAGVPGGGATLQWRG